MLGWLGARATGGWAAGGAVDVDSGKLPPATIFRFFAGGNVSWVRGYRPSSGRRRKVRAWDPLLEIAETQEGGSLERNYGDFGKGSGLESAVLSTRRHSNM